MPAWKIIILAIMALVWLMGIVFASVAPTEEQVADYRKFRDSNVTAPHI